VSKPGLSRQQCRELDRYAIQELGIPGIVLMENAGRGCAEVLLAQSNASFPSLISNQADSTVVVCCGPGNNGGDGLVIARHLSLAGMVIRVLTFSPQRRYRGDALINLQIAERMGIPIIACDQLLDKDEVMEVLQKPDTGRPGWIVDALLGTGASGGLTGSIQFAVEAMNALEARRMAVDLPTGMDCDTGSVANVAVKADITCSLMGPKAGFGNPAALRFLGNVVTVGIGAPLGL
jgi:NAD(P)H-hydrate epimerase